jgi:hypothetical protein
MYKLTYVFYFRKYRKYKQVFAGFVITLILIMTFCKSCTVVGYGNEFPNCAVIMRADDVRHNRFLMRLMSRHPESLPLGKDPPRHPSKLHVHSD